MTKSIPRDDRISQDEQVFITSIANHLNDLSRKVFKVNNEEEILNFLADTFINVINCDFIVISKLKHGKLTLETIRGDFDELETLFPFPIEEVNPVLLERSIKSLDKNLEEDSPVRSLFEKTGIDSWFTIPIAEETDFYGLIIAGYYTETPLYGEMQDSFDKLGNYTAIALQLIKNNNVKLGPLDLDGISQNLIFDNPLYELVNKVISFAGAETNSNFAAIYLLNEEKDRLIFQEPSYRKLTKEEVILIDQNDLLENYLPNVEEAGGDEITIPLISELEMIGIIFAKKIPGNLYTNHDLELLQMYANYFSVMYQNINLMKKERTHREDLEKIINLQQQLIRRTIENEGFTEINSLIGELFETPVVLFDRFMNVIDAYLPENQTIELEKVFDAANDLDLELPPQKSPFDLTISENDTLKVRTIHDGNEFQGFFAIKNNLQIGENLQDLVLNIVNNFYSLQFVKREIKRNTKEQIKYTFVRQLLEDQIDSLEEVLEYAASYNWNLYEPYRVSVISVKDHSLSQITDVIDKNTKQNSILEQTKNLINFYDKDIITSIINNQLVLCTPIGEDSASDYWKQFTNYLSNNAPLNREEINFVIGIGEKTNRPEDYSKSYEKAVETAKILQRETHPVNYAFFNDLGSYTVLSGVKEEVTSKMFVQNYLKELYNFSENQDVDLYETLRVYLQNGGNISKAADQLYLHRSTVTYRINKIKEEINLDIENPNEQFNLILAYKLADLYDNEELFLEEEN